MEQKSLLTHSYFFKSLVVSLSVLMAAGLAVAHPGHHHAAGGEDPHVQPASREATAPQKLINDRYQLEIKPVFEKKCFDCHSSKTTYLWYHQLPGIKEYIDHDIDEAREHIDMENGFPFRSHASPIEDLEAIGDEIAHDEMPPLPYKLMHQGTGLTNDEKEKVRAWVQYGLEQLQVSTPGH